MQFKVNQNVYNFKILEANSSKQFSDIPVSFKKQEHMYNGLIHAHSGLRYITLILLLIVILQSVIGWLRHKNFSSAHKKMVNLNVFFIVFQLLIGFALFFMSSKVMFDPAMFKSTLLRFFTLEHPLMMLISIVLIVHSSAKAKVQGHFKTHKKLFWYHAISLLIIIASIPWPFRAQLGATWF